MLKTSCGLILGSNSPRRKALLQGLGLDFEVKTFDTNENFDAATEVTKVAELLAIRKVKPFQNHVYKNHCVITADTIVIHNNVIYNKPLNEQEAIYMLNQLQNNVHTVITGVAILLKGTLYAFSTATSVSFYPLSKNEILYYINNHKPFDKAGSYGIQEWLGYAKIKNINGCFYNVMGLPTSKLYEKLKSLQFILD